jgi:hypothetical protein
MAASMNDVLDQKDSRRQPYGKYLSSSLLPCGFYLALLLWAVVTN